MLPQSSQRWSTPLLYFPPRGTTSSVEEGLTCFQRHPEMVDYRYQVEKHILPLLGERYLRDLKLHTLQAWIDGLPTPDVAKRAAYPPYRPWRRRTTGTAEYQPCAPDQGPQRGQ